VLAGLAGLAGFDDLAAAAEESPKLMAFLLTPLAADPYEEGCFKLVRNKLACLSPSKANLIGASSSNTFYQTDSAGSAISNGREPKSCLG
jgi:hypothetical protein